MSLFTRLDEVPSFMSTVDLFADSPQGGVGGKYNSQRTWSMAGAMSPSCDDPQGGVGGKVTCYGVRSQRNRWDPNDSGEIPTGKQGEIPTSANSCEIPTIICNSVRSFQFQETKKTWSYTVAQHDFQKHSLGSYRIFAYHMCTCSIMMTITSDIVSLTMYLREAWMQIFLQWCNNDVSCFTTYNNQHSATMIK